MIDEDFEKKYSTLLLNTKELKSILGIGTHAAYALMKSDSFPSFVIGGKYYCSLEHLKEWINNQVLSK